MKELVENVAKKAGDFLVEHFRKDQTLLKLRSSAKDAEFNFPLICAVAARTSTSSLLW